MEKNSKSRNLRKTITRCIGFALLSYGIGFSAHCLQKARESNNIIYLYSIEKDKLNFEDEKNFYFKLEDATKVPFQKEEIDSLDKKIQKMKEEQQNFKKGIEDFQLYKV